MFAVVFIGSRTLNTLAKPLIERPLQVTVTRRVRCAPFAPDRGQPPEMTVSVLPKSFIMPVSVNHGGLFP